MCIRDRSLGAEIAIQTSNLNDCTLIATFEKDRPQTSQEFQQVFDATKTEFQGKRYGSRRNCQHAAKFALSQMTSAGDRMPLQRVRNFWRYYTKMKRWIRKNGGTIQHDGVNSWVNHLKRSKSRACTSQLKRYQNCIRTEVRSMRSELRKVSSKEMKSFLKSVNLPCNEAANILD
eukprot:TRINITY_DN5146_c0_g1_i1.p1 TRINITY_DN5146_c0_g1~~TRINITY_DN5146_c0_g1_i1.p1  ORF type:complete len:175 (+),score=24.48 TRINITY_DN5146_c0_g1_i1:111-635(+)